LALVALVVVGITTHWFRVPTLFFLLLHQLVVEAELVTTQTVAQVVQAVVALEMAAQVVLELRTKDMLAVQMSAQILVAAGAVALVV
jgi:hypothetical protein